MVSVKRTSIEAGVDDGDAANGDANSTSKKPRSASNSTAPAAGPSQHADQTKLLSQVDVGSRIEVYWTGDKKYYPGTLASRLPSGGQHKYEVQYDDGDYHDLDLKKERFRILEDGSIGSDLVIPDGVDTSKFPSGWMDIVRAELKACGMEGGGDGGVEPPSPPPTRMRMGAERTAKHYKVTKAVARVLVKIIDANLEEAGMNASRVKLPVTNVDFKLMAELVKKDLEATGSDRVSHGFWGKVREAHFADRGLTAVQVSDYYRYKKRDERKQKPASEGVSHEKFTDAEDAIIRDAVTRQIQGSGTDKLPIGFWPSVIEAHSMPRDSRQLSKRWYILKNSANSDKVVETSVPLQSSSERDASGDKREQKKAPLQGIFLDEVYQLIEGLVREELQQHGGERVRNGFWGRVLEKHFADHDLTTEQLRDHYKKNKRRRMTASKDLSNSNDAQEANNSRGEPFTSDEDGIVIKEAVKELRDYGKLRNGFWPKVAESYSLKRTPTQLSNRCSYLKSRGKIDLSEISSSDVGGTVTSEQLESAPTTDEEPRDVHDAKSQSDTAPLTDDLIVFPTYQATTTKYPPQSAVIYRPSSGKGSVFGRVLEVGIYPSQNNLYVYTISDDAGTGIGHYERIPERFLEKRR